jgi:hypothetical protein
MQWRAKAKRYTKISMQHANIDDIKTRIEINKYLNYIIYNHKIGTVPFQST